jgi:hypothetical protein
LDSPHLEFHFAASRGNVLPDFPFYLIRPHRTVAPGETRNPLERLPDFAVDLMQLSLLSSFAKN